MNRIKYVTTGFFLFFALSVQAEAVKDTFYVTSGNLQVDNAQIPMRLFTRSPVFDTVDAVIQVQPGDVIELTIYNTINRDVTVGSDLTENSTLVEPGAHATLNLQPTEPGAFGLYAEQADLRYMGLSTAVISGSTQNDHHIWNFRAMDQDLNTQIAKGSSPGFSNFLPETFTLNTTYYSLYTSNQRAKVHGNVNDSIYIHFVNSSIMNHAPHFHGYHVTIVHSNKENKMIGWEKDSFPLKPREIITVLLVPHQPGMFPVHDHNLVTSTTGGNYPGGIMGMLHIAP